MLPRLTDVDVIHLVVQKPLHRISAMARHRRLLPDLVTGCHRAPDGWLRMCSRDKQEIRTKSQHENVCFQQ